MLWIVPAGDNKALDEITYEYEEIAQEITYEGAEASEIDYNYTAEEGADDFFADFSEDARFLVYELERMHPFFLWPGQMPENYPVIRQTFLAGTARSMYHVDFALAMRRYLAAFPDGHMAGVTTYNELGHAVAFPLSGVTQRTFSARPNGLFLRDDSGITSIEIIQIGGVYVEEIYKIIDAHFGSYNEFGRWNQRGRQVRCQRMLEMAGVNIIYDNGNLYVLLTTAQNIQIVSNITPRRELLERAARTAGTPTVFLPPGPRYRRIDDDILFISYNGMSIMPCLQTIAATQTAILDGTRHFVLDFRNSPGGSERFLDSLFEAMGLGVATMGTLIIPSGLSEHGLDFHITQGHLQGWTLEELEDIDYLLIPPSFEDVYNRYGVFIAILTSHFTYSAGPMIASRIVDSGFGAVIGEPPGSSPSLIGSGRTLDLPISRFRIRAAADISLRPDADADAHVLWPCIIIDEEYALDAALELLRSR